MGTVTGGVVVEPAVSVGDEDPDGLHDVGVERQWQAGEDHGERTARVVPVVRGDVRRPALEGTHRTVQHLAGDQVAVGRPPGAHVVGQVGDVAPAGGADEQLRGVRRAGAEEEGVRSEVDELPDHSVVVESFAVDDPPAGGVADDAVHPVLGEQFDAAGRLGGRQVGRVERPLAGAVHAVDDVTPADHRRQLTPELPADDVPVDRHGHAPGLGHAGGADMLDEPAAGRVRRRGEHVVGHGGGAQVGAGHRVPALVELLVVERVRHDAVEQVAAGLDAHPVVRERPAADRSGAHDVHAGAVDAFEQPGVRLPRQRRDQVARSGVRRRQPADPPVGCEHRRERAALSAGPASAPLDERDVDAPLGEAQRGDGSAEPGADHHDPAAFAAPGGRGRCRGAGRQQSGTQGGRTAGQDPTPTRGRSAGVLGWAGVRRHLLVRRAVRHHSPAPRRPVRLRSQPAGSPHGTDPRVDAEAAVARPPPSTEAAGRLRRLPHAPAQARGSARLLR